MNQVIAYGLSIVENADQIVEHHIHRELLTKGGAYCCLRESWYAIICMAKKELVWITGFPRSNRLGGCQADWGRLEREVTNSNKSIVKGAYL